MAAGPNRNDTMKNVMTMDTQNLNPSSSDAMEIESFLLSDCWYDFVNGPGNKIAGNSQAADTLGGINGETSNQIGPNLIENQSLNHPIIPTTTQNLAIEEPLPFSFSTPDQYDHSLHFLQSSYPSFGTLYNNESNMGYSQSQPGPSNVINGVGNYNIPLATNLGNQIVQDQKIIPTVDHQFYSSAPNPSPIFEFSQQTMQAVDPSNFQNPINSGGMFYDSNVVNSQPGPSWETGKQYTDPNFGSHSLYNTNSGHVSAFPSAPVPSDSSDSKIVKQITHYKAGLVRILKLHGDSKVGLFYYAADAVHVKAPQYQYATTFSEKFEFNSNEEAAIFLSNYFKMREQEGYEYRVDQDPPPLFYKILSMRPGDCSSTATTLSADPGPSVAAATANYEANLSDQDASPNSNYDDEGELDMAATNSSANRKYKRRKQREFDLAEQRKLIKTMPLEQLKEWYHLRRDEAAVKLGICETAVTKIYNKYYPDGRWPYRKVNSLIKEMRKLRKLRTNPGERSVDEIVREMDKMKQMLDAIYETDSLEKKDMGSAQTVVCVKRVKQDEPQDWDESMPLPGDIIEGFAQYDADELFQPAKAKSELSSQLGKIGQKVETIWVKVRRGDETHKLRVRVVAEKSSMLHKKYTIRAARDDRHVAVLGDLTLEQCTTLQEMSRRVVNVDYRGFNRKEMKYDWKRKLGTYLPDQGSTVVSSILFMPFQGEYYLEATISRCMAWFTAAVSSGVPLVFVNIQTEQIVTSEKITNLTGKERSRGKQQNHTTSTTVELVQGIRLWFLPGIEEVSLEMIPEPGESRFGMDIKRTDEGFICVYSVAKGSASDRAGLQQLLEEASAKSHLLIISRLEGKSLMPSSVSSAGFIHCCDHNEIRDTLTSAIDRMDIIQLHIMAWPNQTRPNNTPKAIAAAILRPPPDEYCHLPSL